MKTSIKTGLCVLMAGSLLSFAGCKKKAEPARPATNVKVTASKTTASPAAAIETISVADVKTEAAKMNVEQLKAKAMEYKNAIDAKKAEINTVIAKLKESPIAKQMGAEEADLATLNNSLSALTERFQVYYNKLKELGGDVSDLQI